MNWNSDVKTFIRGATFIPGATSIPDSRVCVKVDLNGFREKFKNFYLKCSIFIMKIYNFSFDYFWTKNTVGMVSISFVNNLNYYTTHGLVYNFFFQVLNSISLLIFFAWTVDTLQLRCTGKIIFLDNHFLFNENILILCLLITVCWKP